MPPNPHLTAEFSRQILQGEKQLISLEDVLWIADFPNDSEASTKILWDHIKDDTTVMQYMPDLTDKQVINKKYLLNVLNTVYPNSMKKLCKRMRKKKIKSRLLANKQFIEIAPKY